MISFIIQISEQEIGSAELTGRELHKKFTWPVLPRLNELIYLGGSEYPVQTVRHLIANTDPDIAVEVYGAGVDFTNFLDDPSWEKMY